MATLLPTNLVDDELDTTKNLTRRYNIKNSVGTIIEENVEFEDVTEYQREGSTFGAGMVNQQNQAINDINNNLTTIDIECENADLATSIQTKIIEVYTNSVTHSFRLLNVTENGKSNLNFMVTIAKGGSQVTGTAIEITNSTTPLRYSFFGKTGGASTVICPFSDGKYGTVNVTNQTTISVNLGFKPTKISVVYNSVTEKLTFWLYRDGSFTNDVRMSAGSMGRGTGEAGTLTLTNTGFTYTVYASKYNNGVLSYMAFK